jgi:putative ABC transport system permease protein
MTGAVSSAWYAARLLRDVGERLRTDPGRAGLSFFAVAVGIMVLTSVLSILIGLHAESLRLIRQFGAHVVALTPDSNAVVQQGFPGIRQMQALLKSQLAPARAATMVRVNESAAAWDNAAVWAMEPSVPVLRGWRLVEGRRFDPDDERHAARTALITVPMAEAFRVNVGDTCMIGSHAFTVAGILQEGGGWSATAGGGFASTGERLVMIPLATAHRLGFTPDPGAAAWFVEAADDSSRALLFQQLRNLLSDPSLRAWSPRWITAETLVAGIRTWQRTIGLAAGSIAALCLLLGGATLMSMMLADVRQRIPEIGLRRALGATPGDVAWLFVVESCVITSAAAGAGVLMAGVVLGGFSHRVNLPISLHYFTFVIPVIVSIVLGGVFSFWPARVAARLPPAYALRNA